MTFISMLVCYKFKYFFFYTLIQIHSLLHTQLISFILFHYLIPYFFFYSLFLSHLNIIIFFSFFFCFFYHLLFKIFNHCYLPFANHCYLPFANHCYFSFLIIVIFLSLFINIFFNFYHHFFSPFINIFFLFIFFPHFSIFSFFFSSISFLIHIFYSIFNHYSISHQSFHTIAYFYLLFNSFQQIFHLNHHSLNSFILQIINSQFISIYSYILPYISLINNQLLPYQRLSLTLFMQQPTFKQPNRKIVIFRRPSSNTSLESADSSPIVKKKYIMQKNNLESKQDQKGKQQVDFGNTRKLKICDGQKLSYEVIKKDSWQKRSQFLDKYANDPFMRRKFEKSIEKFSVKYSRSKSREFSQEKKLHSVTNDTPRKVLASQTFTTFREQIKEESKKTVKLIDNCRQLVDELKKHRLTSSDLGQCHFRRNEYKGESKSSHNQGRR